MTASSEPMNNSIVFEGLRSTTDPPSENLTLTKQDRYGYFPARLNQSLAHGRYTILRKLGWGTAASVWLANDNRHQSYVALKIATAFWTERYRDHELLILRRIQESNPTHTGRGYCPHLIDQFRVESEHGEHSVLVTPVSGPSILSIRRLLENDKKRLPLPVLKQWLREMLMALVYIKSESSIQKLCALDFRLPNVLVHVQEPEQISSMLAKNPTIFHPKNHGPQGTAPTFVSQSLSIPDDFLREDSPVPSIVLIDFGGSNWVDKHQWRTCQSEHMRAPEVILSHSWGPPSDIWAFACTVFDLLVGWPLFGDPGPYAPEDVTEEDYDLQQMTLLAGERLSLDFLFKCERRDEFYDVDGNLKRIVPPGVNVATPLAERIRRFAGSLSDSEVDPAVEFIQHGLKLDPGERATAAQLLKHEWLRI